MYINIAFVKIRRDNKKLIILLLYNLKIQLLNIYPKDMHPEYYTVK